MTVSTKRLDARLKKGPPGRSHWGGLWQNPDFLKFWAGETISFIGSQITTLALPLTAVLLLHATPLQMGLLGAAGYAPFLLFTLPAGVWIDRLHKRPILILADIGRTLLLALIPVLAMLGRLEIANLVAIAFAAGVLTVFFQIAYQSYLPALVHPDHLIEGNSKLSASESFGEIMGPSLAGLLVQALSAPIAVLADAFSFLCSASGLMAIHTVETQERRMQARGPMWCEVREGLRVTFGNRFLRAFAGEAATYNFFWQVIQAVFVLYAIRELRLSAGVIGLIVGIGSIGALVGAVLTDRLAGRFGTGRVIVGSAVLSGIMPLAVPLAAGSRLVVAVLLAVAFFIKGFGDTTTNVQTIAIRQRVTPKRLLGRMNASYRLITWGVVPLGALLGGALGESFGLRMTLAVGAGGVVLAFLWLWCSPVRGLQSFPPAAKE